jgi:hypothetical protein
MEATEQAEKAQADAVIGLHDREDRRQKADMIHRYIMQQRAAADARAIATATWDRETAKADRDWSRAKVRGVATAVFTLALSLSTFLLGRGCDKSPAESVPTQQQTTPSTPK